MNERASYPQSEAVVPIGMGILFSLLTCGIYALFWQYKQIQVLNAWLEREELDFLTWLGLSIITCGLFALYYEYKMAKAVNEIQERGGMRVNEDLALLCVGLAVFSFGLVSMAIQQGEINKFYGDNPDL